MSRVARPAAQVRFGRTPAETEGAREDGTPSRPGVTAVFTGSPDAGVATGNDSLLMSPVLIFFSRKPDL